jgi:hypothetical protein
MSLLEFAQSSKQVKRLAPHSNLNVISKLTLMWPVRYSCWVSNFGGRHVRVRGHAKVYTHLMFGLLSITALQLMRLVI